MRFRRRQLPHLISSLSLVLGMSPPLKKRTCPCYGTWDCDFHHFLCWTFHLLYAVMLSYLFVAGLMWIFSGARRVDATEEYEICSICDCIGTKLLCADRGFATFPKLHEDQIASLSIIGLQRNSLHFLDGKALARFGNLLLIDVRDQTTDKCVDIQTAPLPDNLIVRGKSPHHCQ